MADRHAPYHILMDALAAPGCPVCTVVQQHVLRYLDMLIYEHVNDLELRAEIRRAGGFCNVHAWWLITRMRGSALGAAIIYRDVLHTLRERMDTVATAGGSVLPGSRVRRMLTSLAGGTAPLDPHTKCPACEVRVREERVFVGVVVDNLGEWQFIERYGASSGLCVPHLDQALGMARDGRGAQRLLEAHGKIVDRLIAELDEFQRKNDYRFRGEPLGAEATSWQRAIELATGKDGAR